MAPIDAMLDPGVSLEHGARRAVQMDWELGKVKENLDKAEKIIDSAKDLILGLAFEPYWRFV